MNDIGNHLTQTSENSVSPAIFLSKQTPPKYKIYEPLIPRETTLTSWQKLEKSRVTVVCQRKKSSSSASMKRKREEEKEAREEGVCKKAKIEEISQKNIGTLSGKDPRSLESAKTSVRNHQDSIPIRSLSQQPLKRHQQTHHLPVKNEFYLNYIKEGVSTYEGRVCRETCSKMKVGDLLTMKNARANQGIKCEITSCDRYSSFQEMLKAKGVLNMLPELKEKASRLSPQQLIEEGVKIYQSFRGANDVHQLGAIAIGVKYIQDF